MNGTPAGFLQPVFWIQQNGGHAPRVLRSACRKSQKWLFRQAADFFDFIEKVPDCTRKWGLTCFSVASPEGIGPATGSPDPLSHFSPVAYFAWHHFFDSLKRRTCTACPPFFLTSDQGPARSRRALQPAGPRPGPSLRPVPPGRRPPPPSPLSGGCRRRTGPRPPGG